MNTNNLHKPMKHMNEINTLNTLNTLNIINIINIINRCNNIIIMEIDSYFRSNKKAFKLYCCMVTNNPSIFDSNIMRSLVFSRYDIDSLVCNIVKKINNEISLYREYNEFIYDIDTVSYTPQFELLEEFIKGLRETVTLKRTVEKSINSIYKKAIANLIPLPFMSEIVSSLNVGKKLYTLMNDTNAEDFESPENELYDRLSGMIENIRHSIYNDIYKTLVLFIYKEYANSRKINEIETDTKLYAI